MKLTIKKEYKDLIPPLTENEFKQLEENCMHNGIRDAICVIPDLDPPSNYCKYCYEETEMVFEDDLWMCKKCHHFPYQQEFIIVDGHNRFKIAQDNKLDFEVYCLEDIEYDDQYAIKDWIINNQLGRRNLTDNQKKQLRGLKYNNEKAKHGGTGANQYQQSGQNDHSAKTHDRLAEELGVSSRTIRRDGEWVKGLEHIDEELKQDILQQKIKVRASDIQEIAKAEPMFIAHSKDDIIKKAREIQKEKKAEKERDKLKTTKTSNLDINIECNSYDENMFYMKENYNDKRFDDHVFSLDAETYPVITTGSKLFDKEYNEYSLRTYADIQTFPKDYKFVGPKTTIKKQIGNSVAPKMAEYIAKNLKGKTAGDLFAGCGGFSYGLHKNGIDTKWAIEWNKDAAQAYKLNFPETKVYNSNIVGFDLSILDKVDIIIGGPPCKGFSRAGYQFKDDPRNHLYKEFVKIVNIILPNEFILENVPEIEAIKNDIIEDFKSIGYDINMVKVSGNEIGMKSNRKRIFFIGKNAL